MSIMMSWSSLAFLIIGAGIGVVVGRRLGRSPQTDRPINTIVDPGVEHPAAASSQDLAILTQLKQTELAYQMASELSQFQAGFLARTSHELRSPINSVISLHQLILADLCESPEEEREYVAQASVAAQRMLATLDELIAISKVQHGRIELQMQPVNLKLILDDAYQITHLQAKNRNLRLQIQPPTTDVYVLADLTRLRQVVVNLIDRAIAHLDSGYIYVIAEAELDAGVATITIADDRPEADWAEAIDRLQSPAKTAQSEDASAATFGTQLSYTPLPPGLTLFADRTLMEEMNGTLEIVPNLKGDRGYAIQCAMPIVAPED